MLLPMILSASSLGWPEATLYIVLAICLTTIVLTLFT